MAHEITVRKNGFAEAMYAFKPAWHGLGQVVDKAPTSAEAMKLAGLLWRVEQHPIQTIVTQQHLDGNGDTFEKSTVVDVDSRVANVRSDNLRVLGVVGKSYTPVQNAEAFAFVDGLVETGEIRYEAAGSLKGGRTIWLLARMPGQIEVTGQDVTRRYILFTNGHDGTKAVRVMPTSVRVVCENTLNLAVGGARGNWLTIMHTAGIHHKLEQARDVLGLVKTRFEEYGQVARTMVAAGITPAARRQFVYDLFPDVADANNARRKKVRAEIGRLMSDGPQMLDGIRGSAWAAFNAVTQYVDHHSRTQGAEPREKAENRMSSVLYGRGAQIKARAWTQARQLAAV
ncbi:MAG: DUF932 domain-containing protein [Planctomycetes bacterium]|nr:DUF932 domain-containing protein [Planctomycetota bacterium]